MSSGATSMAVMADSDSIRGSACTGYGPVELLNAAAVAAAPRP